MTDENKTPGEPDQSSPEQANIFVIADRDTSTVKLGIPITRSNQAITIDVDPHTAINLGRNIIAAALSLIAPGLAGVLDAADSPPKKDHH